MHNDRMIKRVDRKLRSTKYRIERIRSTEPAGAARVHTYVRDLIDILCRFQYLFKIIFLARHVLITCLVKQQI